ncbi:MAG: tetratricopeptide repeat protein [Pseudomonadota bacterium]
MTNLSEQLEAIFQEINVRFSQHPQIQVTPIAGTPPEQYRISYHLQGLCKEDKGEVRECTDHVVTLTLPFGFPHFSPNCKPETPVFHPDFDQAAICIGDFWENNQSLSELIIHIGRMLCGEIYSTNNAFNEEAALWYQENQNRLPLDTIHQLSTSSTLLPSEEQTSSAETPLAIDLVDDILFPGDEVVDVDEVEILKQRESSFPEIVTEKSLPPRLSLEPASDPTKQSSASADPDSQMQRNLKEAHQKHQEGETFEHQGNPAKALQRYTEAKNLVHDFPEIDKDINRAQYSLEMLGGWAAEDVTEKNTTNGKQKTTSKYNGKPVTPTPQKSEPSQAKRKQSSSRWQVFAACGCLACLLILSFSYIFLTTRLEHAQTLFKECKELQESKQITEAEQKCTDALMVTSKIFLIKQDEKKRLAAEIKQLQDSINRNKGPALSNENSRLLEWQQAMQLADQQLADGNWQAALTGHTHALQLASAIPMIDQSHLEQIRKNITTSEFNMALQAGEQALARTEGDDAKKYFDKALDLARKNPQIPAATISRIQSLNGQVEFIKLMTSGNEYFSKGDWTNALTAFEHAQEIERKFSFSDAETLASLQEVLARAKVFNSLEQGKKAFADAQWDHAISLYEKALQLLAENRELLRRDNPLQSQQKISRLMLHAAIIRDQQSVANHLKNREFTKAIDKLQAIIETTNMSTFASEEEFQTIIKETHLSINQAQEELLKNQHISYLTENYKKLFTQNNPTLNAANLSNPRATFLKKIGGKMLYRIQCSEQGHSRPVLLQTNYIYDPATSQWRFFSNENSANEQDAIAAGQKILASAYQAKEERLIAEQILYLADNFQALFIQDNPSLLPENLSKPQASFLKNIGGKMLFMLQCSAQETGDSTLLKVSYLYDPQKNQWELYHK